MRLTRRSIILPLLMLAAAGLRVSAVGGANARSTQAAASRRALVDRYCVTCHNTKLKTGGLALDSVDAANVGPAADVWEKVVRKVRAGMMPPAGRPRPDAAAS